jgi:hypothetical protein
LVHGGHGTPGALRLPRPGEHAPGLRDRVDAAFLAGGRAERRAVVELAPPVPAAVPSYTRSAKLSILGLLFAAT